MLVACFFQSGQVETQRQLLLNSRMNSFANERCSNHTFKYFSLPWNVRQCNERRIIICSDRSVFKWLSKSQNQNNSRANEQANYRFQPTTNRWNSCSNLLVSMRSKVNHGMAWHEPKPIPPVGFTTQLDFQSNQQ